MFLPDAQYENFKVVEYVMTLLEVVYVPFIGPPDASPMQPVAWTVAVQAHPPPLAASLQVTEV